MMRVKAKQLEAWERDDLEQWFATTFPERVIGQPRADVDAYLTSRGSGAAELGFTRGHHLRYLIGYELGCGVAWLEESGAPAASGGSPSAPVLDILRRRDLDPDRRIEAAERLLYGDSDD